MSGPAPNILDLGCGRRKRPGAVGIDIDPDSAADVVHDLDTFPYPFPDSTFDVIYVDNVIEHLADVVAVMTELHRIARPGGLVRVIVPYFRARWAYIDPTHRHFFTVDSFSYFDASHVHSTLYPYSKARFALERLVFNDGIVHPWPVSWLIKPFVAFANARPAWYEAYVSHLVPLDQLTFDLRAAK